MTWSVAVAIAGALAAALGAALQERAAMRAPVAGISQLRLLRHLARSRRWCAGSLLTVAGVGAHMWALGHAPLIIIQPIGISGLLFAVLLSAFFRKRRPSSQQVFGSLAVMAALTGLLSTVPTHAVAPDLTPSEMVLMSLACAAAMLLCVAVARLVGDAARAWTLAVAGGVAYAMTSALARVIGVGAVADPAAVISPLTAVALVIGLCGALVVQNSYRTGHFALAYATLLISDPLAATLIGVAFFGERVPTDPVNASIAIVAALVGTVGVVTLARASRHGSPRPVAAVHPSASPLPRTRATSR
ncbi:DMT family transporter [Nocardiopsis mangrovi]|uniref:DMT family transporter n=1 Tax=Nocardiopsis mangrovi TaxID=1179818 RepID=A0ABV9DYR3_9ACTN